MENKFLQIGILLKISVGIINNMDVTDINTRVFV